MWVTSEVTWVTSHQSALHCGGQRLILTMAPELWEVGAHSAISGLSSDSVSVSLRPLPPRPRQQLLVRWPGEDRGWSAWERVQPTLVTDSEWTQPSDEQREHHYTALSMCYSHTVISSYGLNNSFHSTFSNQKVYIQSENSLWYGVLVYPVLQKYVLSNKLAILIAFSFSLKSKTKSYKSWFERLVWVWSDGRRLGYFDTGCMQTLGFYPTKWINDSNELCSQRRWRKS